MLYLSVKFKEEPTTGSEQPHYYAYSIFKDQSIFRLPFPQKTKAVAMTSSWFLVIAHWALVVSLIPGKLNPKITRGLRKCVDRNVGLLFTPSYGLSNCLFHSHLYHLFDGSKGIMFIHQVLHRNKMNPTKWLHSSALASLRSSVRIPFVAT